MNLMNHKIDLATIPSHVHCCRWLWRINHLYKGITIWSSLGIGLPSHVTLTEWGAFKNLKWMLQNIYDPTKMISINIMLRDHATCMNTCIKFAKIISWYMNISVCIYFSWLHKSGYQCVEFAIITGGSYWLWKLTRLFVWWKLCM